MKFIFLGDFFDPDSSILISALRRECVARILQWMLISNIQLYKMYWFHPASGTHHTRICKSRMMLKWLIYGLLVGTWILEVGFPAGSCGTTY